MLFIVMLSICDDYCIALLNMYRCMVCCLDTAHWWGNGNEDVYTWNSHGVFVRMLGSYLSKGSGTQANPGLDCATLKSKFVTYVCLDIFFWSDSKDRFREI